MNDFKLDNGPRISSGFTTPEGYFDTFSDKVLAQLPKQEPKVISIFSAQKIGYYAVAAVVVILMSIPLYIRYSANNQEVDDATLENYLAYNSTISEDEIVDLLNQEDLDKMKMEIHLDDAAIEETLKSNANLEEYLID